MGFSGFDRANFLVTNEQRRIQESPWIKDDTARRIKENQELAAKGISPLYDVRPSVIGLAGYNPDEHLLNSYGLLDAYKSSPSWQRNIDFQNWFAAQKSYRSSSNLAPIGTDYLGRPSKAGAYNAFNLGPHVASLYENGNIYYTDESPYIGTSLWDEQRKIDTPFTSEYFLGLGRAGGNINEEEAIKRVANIHHNYSLLPVIDKYYSTGQFDPAAGGDRYNWDPGLSGLISPVGFSTPYYADPGENYGKYKAEMQKVYPNWGNGPKSDNSLSSYIRKYPVLQKYILDKYGGKIGGNVAPEVTMESAASMMTSLVPLKRFQVDEFLPATNDMGNSLIQKTNNDLGTKFQSVQDGAINRLLGKLTDIKNNRVQQFANRKQNIQLTAAGRNAEGQESNRYISRLL